MCDTNLKVADESADEEFHDFVEASESSTNFWNHPDDDDWNDA
jgi:hypothetical protein